MFYINLDKDSKPRYDFDKFMEFIENGYDVLSSYFIYKIKSLPIKGVFKVTNESFKPELISYKIYSNTGLWKILMIYNDLRSFDEIYIGNEINYPSIDSLEELYFSLKAKQTQVEG